MAKIITDDKYYKDIADTIRLHTGYSDKYRPENMSAGIDAVMVVSNEEGQKAGRKSQHYEKWNKFTANNTRRIYMYAFSYSPDGSFDPPFAVKPISAEGMFRNTEQKRITSEQLDLSACTNFPYGFYGTKLEELGVIDLSKNDNNISVFCDSHNLRTIEKVIFKDDGSSQTDVASLFAAKKLENITIGGKIGKNISFQYCSALSFESLISIINALKDYSGTADDGVYTLYLSSESIESLRLQGNASPNGNTWIDYVYDKGWNV